MSAKRSAFTQLSGLLPHIFSEIQQADRARLAIIKDGWSRIVGPVLARHTQPQELKHGTLTVSTQDPQWKTEFQALAPLVLQKMNALLGRRSIRYCAVRLQTEPRAPVSAKR